MKEAAKRLEELVNLKDDWDGYGSKPVKPENAKFALEILKQIQEPDFPTPQFCPGSDGELQIEWYTDVGEMQLYITAPNNAYFWTDNIEVCPGGEADEGIELTNDFTRVKKQLRYLTKNTK